ncbi:hypothetical protein cgR_2335 [Corynebacterium glutamicum R]|uniref:Uncharacterized protein n=2 Tax=Corynebacterium glutamicum TaxID=1718 RepID=Q5KRC3_CORGT|nr:hypothetical protein [Corynebacterium glutamicum]BAF55340.1 hypothetical protein cgR_2335 [Corynebacterium glutamicum R]
MVANLTFSDATLIRLVLRSSRDTGSQLSTRQPYRLVAALPPARSLKGSSRMLIQNGPKNLADQSHSSPSQENFYSLNQENRKSCCFSTPPSTPRQALRVAPLGHRNENQRDRSDPKCI